MRLKILGLLLLLAFLVPIKEGCVIVPIPEPEAVIDGLPTAIPSEIPSGIPTEIPTPVESIYNEITSGGGSGSIIENAVGSTTEIKINVTTEDGALPSSSMEVK